MKSSKSLPGIVIVLLVVWMPLSAQDAQEVKDTDKRLLSLGIKGAFTHQFSSPSDNPSGVFTSTDPLLDVESYTFSIDGQLLLPNGSGFGLELGLRRQIGSAALDRSSKLFNGNTTGEFPHRSFFVAPSYLFNRDIGKRSSFMAGAGAEFHSTQSAPKTSFYADRFGFTTNPFFINLSAGGEVRANLQDAFWLGFFAKITYGLGTSAELFYRPEESTEFIKVGEYRGTGFDFGIRLSYCLSCK